MERPVERLYLSSALYLATYSGHGRVVELLLQSGAEVHALGNDNYTALSRAVCFGHMKVVNVLLAHGAEVDLTGMMLPDAARQGLDEEDNIQRCRR